MTPRELHEYQALRDTIRERGTTRVWVFVTGLIAWAVLLSATALARRHVAGLAPALVLSATFEAVYSLHTGVERIGRYIQVFFEDTESTPGWEGRLVQFGQPGEAASGGWLLAGSGDALFTVPFCAAALTGLLAAAAGDGRPWWVRGLTAALYLLFIARLLAARRFAAHQRSRDLERFRQLR